MNIIKNIMGVVEYYKEMAHEEPFILGGIKWVYCWGKYPGGKIDVAVYRFSHDLAYDYNDFREAMGIDKPVQKNINENMENTIKDKILRLKTVQEQLDAALKTYKEAITELESEKDKLVPEVMEAFKGQTVGAEKLKLKVDDFIVEIVQESEKETLSYKTMSELLMEEIKRLDIALSRTAQQLQEDSKAASIVKGRLKIGGVKVYENEEDSLSGKLINWLGKSSEIKNKTILSAEQSMEAIEDMMIKDYDETEANKYATPNMDDVESGALRQEGEDHEMEEGEDHEMEEGSWMETRAGANGEVFEMDEKLNEAINRYKKIINY